MAVPGVNVVSWSDIGATPANFNLPGGRYQIAAVAGSWGTATLNQVGPDGETLLPVLADPLSANGLTTFEVAKGHAYQLTLAGVTAFYGSISQIPLSPAA